MYYIKKHKENTTQMLWSVPPIFLRVYYKIYLFLTSLVLYYK